MVVILIIIAVDIVGVGVGVVFYETFLRTAMLRIPLIVTIVMGGIVTNQFNYSA